MRKRAGGTYGTVASVISEVAVARAHVSVTRELRAHSPPEKEAETRANGELLQPFPRLAMHLRPARVGHAAPG